MRIVQLGLFAGLTLSLVGCGAKTHSVSGTVTYEGSPLPEGSIAFVPEKGGKGASAAVSNGQYSLSVPPGKYRVEINASKTMKLPPGETGMSGEKEEVRQYIPAKYNANSELKADVPPPGALDFGLKKE